MATKLRFFFVTMTESMSGKPITEGILTENNTVPSIGYLSRVYTDRVYSKEHVPVQIAVLCMHEFKNQKEFEEFVGAKVNIDDILSKKKE